MHFERSELQQLTPEYVEGLPTEQKSNLIEQLRKDLMQARDRLNLNPSNSSKPPSSRAPWDRSTSEDNQSPEDKLSDSGDEEELPNCGETGSSKSGESNPKGDKGNKKRKPGKQPGSKGFGRTQKLAITREIVHRPTHCKGCSVALDKDLPFIATEGHYTIDLKLPESGCIGLLGEYVKNIYGKVSCECGFETATKAKRVENESGWVVQMGEVTRWLWAAIGDDVAYYTVGPRSSETAEKILKGFKGWLMTDGYGVYRKFEKRLRCWSHLDRKAKALKDSWDKEAASFGECAVKTLESFRRKVYRMREMEQVEREQVQSICDEERLNFIFECLQKVDSNHEKTRAFSVEILNLENAVENDL